MKILTAGVRGNNIKWIRTVVADMGVYYCMTKLDDKETVAEATATLIDMVKDGFKDDDGYYDYSFLPVIKSDKGLYVNEPRYKFYSDSFTDKCICVATQQGGFISE